MQRIMLRAKIHKATVTESRLDYEGSLALDSDLMAAVRILPYEKLMVANLANGNRFETYAIPAEAGSGTVSLNGAAALLGAVGDRIIIFTFGVVSEQDAASHRPLILVLDENNKPIGGLKE